MTDLPASWKTQSVSMSEEKANAREISMQVMLALTNRLEKLAKTDERLVDLEVARWVDALVDYPKRAVEAAFAKWARSSPYEPKISEIVGEITKIIRADPALLLQRDVQWAKEWMDRHTTIATWMDRPELVRALISDGFNESRLRHAGFSIPVDRPDDDQKQLVAEVIKISGRNLKA